MKALCVLAVLLGTFAVAQTAPTNPPINHATVLASMEQAGYSTVGQLQALRIDKWKTESGQKQQAQQNADSLIRNMTAALPTMIATARTNPQSFAANFKLYRNISALYDVMLPLAESAGAFGRKGEFQALGEQLQRWDEIRRQFGDYLEQLAASKDVAAANAAAGSAAKAKAKKIIVDDTAPAPKKKKSVPKQ
jgi:hypothetical protein